MQQYIIILEPILSIVLAIFICLFLLGLVIKIISIFITIMAYPTYLALYSFELLLQYKEKHLSERKFFRLNIPKGTQKGLWMNLLAMLNTTLLIGIFLIFIQSIINFKFVSISYELSFTVIGCLFLIYLISYNVEEVDTKTAYDKINSLTIPSLWKKIIK